MRTRILSLLLVSVAVLATGGWAASAEPAGPVNDNYLSSLNINDPGKPLNHKDTLEQVLSTAGATVQTNLLNPCGQASCPNGPAEPTTCHGVNYGATIWYDFFPSGNGAVRIRTSGFPNVIAVFPYSQRTFIPNLGKGVCVAQPQFPSNELDMNVKKGLAYTIQIGGVNDVTGSNLFQFDFFLAPPHRLTAQSTLKARALSNGIQLIGLAVNTNRAAKVSVGCGRFCKPASKIHSATEKFPSLKGVTMPSGSKLKIRVTAPHSIGVYIEYDIQPGNFSKLTRCLEPGSSRPRKKCH
jgi:hypothetical protein